MVIPKPPLCRFTSTNFSSHIPPSLTPASNSGEVRVWGFRAAVAHLRPCREGGDRPAQRRRRADDC
jgi:hypothetical protein